MDKILIIDPNTDYQLIHKRKLNCLRATLHFCSNIKEAISRLQKNKYEIILLEHLHKNLKGQEVYKLIRDTGYKGPVIVLTNDRHLDRNSYNGISSLLPKTTTSNKLCDIILKHLEKQNSNINIEETL